MTSSAKVYRFGKILAGFAAIAAAVAVCAPAPNAGSEHFVVVNNDIFMGLNSATVMRAAGTKLNPLLDVVKTLQTGVTDLGLAVPDVAISRDAADICVFVGNGDADGGNAISSFKYPSLSFVGNYTDSAIPNAEVGIAMAIRGSRLFAGYGGGGANGNSNIGVWVIGPGCTLTLLNNTLISGTNGGIDSIAATPDGRALLVSYISMSQVDSFSVNSDGSVTERGPYSILDIGLDAMGIDITADGKYGFFSIHGDTFYNYTQIAIFPINADGSLGNYYNIGGDGSLGPGEDEGYLRFSPDQRFLYSDNAGMTTLNFIENPLNLTYTGCFTKLRTPKGQRDYTIGGLATATPSGAGEASMYRRWPIQPISWHF